MAELSPPIGGPEFNSTWSNWLFDFFSFVKELHGVQSMTKNGVIKERTESVELNHATTIIASTIADSKNHPGLFIVKNTGGAIAHTCTLTSGTWDGTNNVATLNAPGETLVVYFDSLGDGIVLHNTGVILS